ncbi:MAG TPA: TonB-dependent receptor [Pyrinomonadaceae bacterium]|nr:TonB-dependent receptor [Pyrinomonadaceae bacterium]
MSQPKFLNRLRAVTLQALFRACLLFLAATFCATTLRAQTNDTANVRGQVLDQNKAAIVHAKVLVTNELTGLSRETETDGEGRYTIAGLPLTGRYSLSVTYPNFARAQVNSIELRAGETAAFDVTLVPGCIDCESAVTVYGTTEGVRADPQIGRRLDSPQIDETPILGRKVTTLPLLNSAFRPAKGTGDLFVNQTYFVTGAGGRRETTVVLDGASDDESWGRQTALITVPIGAVQEMNLLTNSFSAEFGWTAGPAINIVTKSGTNNLHGEGLLMIRPGGWQAKTFSTTGFCPPSVASCVTPATLTAVNPADVPDKLGQFSGSVGGPIVKDKTFFFAAADYTRQDRTTFLSGALPAFVLPADGNLAFTGNYRQELADVRLDHKFTPSQTLTLRFNLDRFYDTNPQDAVGGTSAPSVARRYSRRGWSAQANHTWVLNPNLLNEARFDFLNGDPVTLWESQNLSTTYTRSGSVPFTIGQSRVANLYSRQGQFSDTLTWVRGKHNLRFGGSAARHTSGGTGNEPGTAVLGTFTFKTATTAPFGQLTLNDVQQYTQPINFGISSYVLSQWLLAGYVQDNFRVRPDLTFDLGLRYDRQTLTDATKNFAPRVGFAWNPKGDARLVIRGGYGMYYTQIRSNVVASALIGGLDGLATYTAVAGQTGFPTCLTGPCLPLSFDPRTLPASQLPARDITINPGQRAFYEAQFAKFGLNFDLLPNYPDKLLNPRSQVMSIGAEREFGKGFFVGSDYVHQHWTGIDRTVDLNAPSVFDRTAPGQTRSVAAANATRPILPVNGGVRQVNVLMNLGVADYNGLQTQVSYRGNRKMYAAVSYTLSKATNTTEPDGNGINPNQSIISRLGEEERGPSLLDQRHRAVITFTYRLPLNITAGTLAQFASARPFNATTGVDNNGDGANNDRPVINGAVIGKSAFRGTATSDVAVFIEDRIKTSERTSILLRLEGFNIFNHANILGRAQTTYGDTGTPNPTFGQLVAVGTSANALPALANIDPPRAFQFQVRFIF